MPVNHCGRSRTFGAPCDADSGVSDHNARTGWLNVRPGADAGRGGRLPESPVASTPVRPGAPTDGRRGDVVPLTRGGGRGSGRAPATGRAPGEPGDRAVPGLSSGRAVRRRERRGRLPGRTWAAGTAAVHSGRAKTSDVRVGAAVRQAQRSMSRSASAVVA